MGANTTYTLNQTIQWCQTFAQIRPLTGVGGFSNEPALSIGNWVRQFMLSAPFKWRWNRKIVTFQTTKTPITQDYVVSIPDFGYLEKASINSGSEPKELEVRIVSGTNTLSQDKSTYISPLLDDDNGNITFRLMPAPDDVYTVSLIYQKLPGLFSAPTDTWAPIPDYFTYLYNQGFVAKTYEQMDDPRFVPAMQLFFRQVIAADNGLSETEKNLFLTGRINLEREAQEKIQTGQQARAGRGMWGA